MGQPGTSTRNGVRRVKQVPSKFRANYNLAQGLAQGCPLSAISSATMKTIVALAFVAHEVDAHGSLMHPKTRGGVQAKWFNEGCWIGCSTCSLKKPSCPSGKPNCNYRNYPDWKKCKGEPMEPTLTVDSPYRTWNMKNKSFQADWTEYHPWRAPGHAEVADPCSVNGASKGGKKGTSLPKGKAAATWQAGEKVEASWNTYGANHGGGYQYRLCPADGKVTEECFRKMPIPFANEEVIIRYNNGTDKRIPSMDLSQGTKPAGSTWRRIPYPACACDQGRDCNKNKVDIVDGTLGGSYPNLDLCYDKSAPAVAHTGSEKCICGTQFEPPLPGVYGNHKWSKKWFVVDELRVPEVPSGDYVLQWRWDTEQTPQVWAHCSDIKIKGGGPVPAPTPEPTPEPTPTPSGGCSFQQDRGTADKNPIEVKKCSSADECCSRCTSNAECTHFTLVKGSCKLKTGLPGYIDVSGAVSGELRDDARLLV